MTHNPEAVEIVARALASAFVCGSDDIDKGIKTFRDEATALLTAIGYTGRALDAAASFRAGMLRAAEICDITAKQIEGHTKDAPVNWAANCRAYIHISADELDAEDVAADLLAAAIALPQIARILAEIRKLGIASPGDWPNGWPSAELEDAMAAIEGGRG